jgi:two-component system chemotaxis response regulator CheY
MRALLLDDSRVMRGILGNILKGLGFEVVEAGNGREGLERLRQAGKPDVVLADWNMPEMGGLEFVRALRAEPGYDSVRVLMVTTETEQAQMSAALEAGANEYVLKPFTRDVLLEKLRRAGLALDGA